MNYLEIMGDEDKKNLQQKLGYFCQPSEVFGEVAKRGNGDTDNFV